MSVPKINISDGASIFLNKKGMAKEMYNLAPKSLKTFMNIDKYSGEAFNIVVNALGTGMVAPVCIAYNPLSKTDEKTKKYSALRQPVSAVLAVATQAGLVIPWDRMVDYFANNGMLNFGTKSKYFSLEACQDSKYLFRYFKHKNPNASKEAISKMVEEYQAKQFGELYANLLNDGKIIVNGTPLKEESVLDLINETCADIIKKNQETLGRYQNEKFRAKEARANYLIQNYDTAKTKLNELITAISGKSDEDAIKILKEKAKTAKQDGTAEEWIKIIQNDLIPKGKTENIIEHIKHILGNADNYKRNSEHLPEYLRNMIELKKLSVTKQIKHFEDIQTMIKEKESITKIIERLRQTEISVEGIKEAIKLDNAGVMVVEKYISSMQKRLKATKAISGLLVSLAILPLTCHALNYLYPRFMEKFFPDLANAKKKGGNK